MKALTLYQPYASLIAAGMKRIETRSWPTSYRGPLAIHAAKHIPPEYRNLWLREPFQSALIQAGIVTVAEGSILGMNATRYQVHEERYHLGCVIAVAELVNCIRIPENHVIARFPNKTVPWLPPNSTDEYHFGDYTSGRYVWLLINVQPLPEPVLVRGRQGLWEWEGMG